MKTHAPSIVCFIAMFALAFHASASDKVVEVEHSLRNIASPVTFSSTLLLRIREKPHLPDDGLSDSVAQLTFRYHGVLLVGNWKWTRRSWLGNDILTNSTPKNVSPLKIVEGKSYTITLTKFPVPKTRFEIKDAYTPWVTSISDGRRAVEFLLPVSAEITAN